MFQPAEAQALPVLEEQEVLLVVAVGSSWVVEEVEEDTVCAWGRQMVDYLGT